MVHIIGVWASPSPKVMGLGDSRVSPPANVNAHIHAYVLEKAEGPSAPVAVILIRLMVAPYK